MMHKQNGRSGSDLCQSRGALSRVCEHISSRGSGTQGACIQCTNTHNSKSLNKTRFHLRVTSKKDTFPLEFVHQKNKMLVIESNFWSVWTNCWCPEIQLFFGCEHSKLSMWWCNSQLWETQKNWAIAEPNQSFLLEIAMQKLNKWKIDNAQICVILQSFKCKLWKSQKDKVCVSHCSQFLRKDHCIQCQMLQIDHLGISLNFSLFAFFFCLGFQGFLTNVPGVVQGNELSVGCDLSQRSLTISASAFWWVNVSQNVLLWEIEWAMVSQIAHNESQQNHFLILCELGGVRVSHGERVGHREAEWLRLRRKECGNRTSSDPIDLTFY